MLRDPERVEVAPESTAAETVDQSLLFVNQGDKRDLLVHLLKQEEVETALVFTRTKYGADKVVRFLNRSKIKAEAIHGNKTQPQRERAMKAFKSGKLNVLVATDIAARGIDVSGVSHVINYEIPNISETYVHRIGRTGRAGASGVAWSLVNEDDERKHMADIQRLMDRKVPVMTDQPWHNGLEEIELDRGRGTGQGNRRSQEGGDRTAKKKPGRKKKPFNRRHKPGGGSGSGGSGDGSSFGGNRHKKPSKKRNNGGGRP